LVGIKYAHGKIPHRLLHRSFTAAIPPQTQKESTMKRIVLSTAIALLLTGSGGGTLNPVHQPH